jgi:hypothetical protein
MDNPHWTMNCRRQYSQKINVWCGIYRNRVIGPFFFETTLNVERFLNFLNEEIFNVLDDLSLEERRNIIFQPDGAPVNNTHAVREWLDHMYVSK